MLGYRYWVTLTGYLVLATGVVEREAPRTDLWAVPGPLPPNSIVYLGTGTK